MVASCDLWLLRHPKVEVATGLCYGATDVPMQKIHARQCVAEWAETLPNAITLTCSPLSRCERPSQWIRGPRGDIALEIDPRLVEMNFCAWEMRAWSDIGESAVSRWTHDFIDHQPGGGESVRQLLSRVSHALADTLSACQQNQQPVAAWLTHAGVIRAVQVIASGQMIESAADWPNDPVEFGSTQVVRICADRLSAFISTIDSAPRATALG